jgi:hypothetical protein
MKQHLAAGTSASALDEAQMAGGDGAFRSELQLAHPPSVAPLAQQFTDGALRRSSHVVTVWLAQR